MTAKTSRKLADVLRKAGFDKLAERAETDEFHDYLSPHWDCSTRLDRELAHLIQTHTGERRRAAEILRARHWNGDFDASKEESDEWAASPEGQATFGQLIKGKKR